MTTPAKEIPRVEELLRQAHAHEAELQQAIQGLLTRGLAADDLPDGRALRALALLGDHERAAVLVDLRGHWDDLRERGLVREDLPDEVATPLLRLLSFTLGHLHQIVPLQEALNVTEAPSPPAGMFGCASQIRGVYWGQPLIIQFAADGIEALRIHGDAVFDLDPVLLRATDGQLSGECELLADTGKVTFTMIASTSGIYQHVLSITTAKTLEELA